MIMTPPVVLTDSFGSPVLLIKSVHLQDFQALLKWINDNGHSQFGILKLRLHADDRDDMRCVNDILATMQQKLKETVVNGRKKDFSFYPSSQTLLKASLHDHIYELRHNDCTTAQRKAFVTNAVNDFHYVEEENCCTECLSQDGLKGLRKHFFGTLEKSSDWVDEIRHRMNVKPFNSSMEPIIYGAGIPTNPAIPVHVCKNFTMTTLDKIINEQDEKFDGISHPYIYSGSLHSLFPWHIEDVGLYSLSYLAKGSKKIWFGIAPMHFGFVDQVAQSLRISKSHTSCRVLLADHKTLVADPQYFTDNHRVPYTTVVQEEGEFVMTFPFALHAGFNIGNNLAIAVNFADIGWIELGIYAPSCDCYKHQVKFDFSKILKKFRPDLLNMYLEGTALLFPPGHPREVRRPAAPMKDVDSELRTTTNQCTPKNQPSMKPISATSTALGLSSEDSYERLLSMPRRYVSVTQKFVEDALGLGTSSASQGNLNVQLVPKLLRAAPSTGSALGFTPKIVPLKRYCSMPRHYVPVTQNAVDVTLGPGPSQVNLNEESAKKALCFCQQKFKGSMLYCDLCRNSFHSKCVNVTKQDAQSSAKWFCHWCATIRTVQEEYVKSFSEKLSHIEEERLLHYGSLQEKATQDPFQKEDGGNEKKLKRIRKH